MAARSLEKTYSPTESRLYEQARNMLAGELALAWGTDLDASMREIERLTKVAEPEEA
jgi:RNA polymerase-interacting CarD/CdnL/TRCF family regulator